MIDALEDKDGPYEDGYKDGGLAGYRRGLLEAAEMAERQAAQCLADGNQSEWLALTVFASQLKAATEQGGG
jgi:hypothetical protein